MRLDDTPLDWQPGHYERTHGRQSTADLPNALAQGVLAQLTALTSPGDSSEGDARRDARALQENPETMFAHRDLMTPAGRSRQDDRRASP